MMSYSAIMANNSVLYCSFNIDPLESVRIGPLGLMVPRIEGTCRPCTVQYSWTSSEFLRFNFGKSFP